MWHKILSESSISDLGIRSILNLYLIPALNIAAQVNLKDGLEKAKYVSDFPCPKLNETDKL
jgi:hypothetical protein